MTTLGDRELRKSDLYYAGEYRLTASGVFQFADATYTVRFHTESGLLRCLDVMLSFPVKPATPRLALRPQGYEGEQPEWPVSSVRFDFSPENGVAAAVLLAQDKDATTHTWMTRGSAGHSDLLLTHDSWDAQNKPLPPGSYIAIPELREMLCQWAFGDVLPPPSVHWTRVPHETVGW